MNLHNIFDIKRLSHLMLNDLRMQTKNSLIVAATLIILFTILPFHATSSTTVYFMILYIGGFIITSFAFKDFQDPLKAYHSLMLPCSNLERFLNKWFLTSIGYALGTLIIYYLFSVLNVGINLLFYHQPIHPLNILQPDLWSGIGKYVIMQSVILLGAIVFKRYALIKTVLSIGILSLGISVLTVMIAKIFCPSCLQHCMTFSISTTNQHFIYWLIAAPFCWMLTYYRLTAFELR